MCDKWELKPPKILDDKRENKDLFPGHKRVADAIVELIMQQEGGKAIALTGSWGSGKSSVVGYVKEKLEESKNLDVKDIRVFEFDAWEHRGDPLRRSFLEALVSRLVEDKEQGQKEWVKSKDWEKEKNQLSEKRTTSDSKPDLGIWGLLFALTVVLASIGLAILSALNYLAEFSDYAFILGILPAGAIALAILFKGGEWLYHWRRGHKKYRPIITIGTTQAETSTQIIEHLGSTSIEFRDFYLKILKDALGKNQNRRLVIVVDNLDRIEPEQARDVWATMLTFFSLGVVDKPASEDKPDEDDISFWQKRLWLLVPYDPSALDELWDNIEYPICGEPVCKPNIHSLSHHFEEKTFQTFFHIPPLPLSKVNDYLKTQFKEVFEGIDVNEQTIHNVARVFELGREMPDKERKDKAREAKERITEMKVFVPSSYYPRRDLPQPTAREVKLFLNKLSAIYRQWGNEIPLPVQALFAVKDISGWWSKSRFLSDEKDIKGKLTTMHLNPDWKIMLAMIYFGVQEPEASELLYHDIILRALIDREPEELKRFVNNKGFEIVLNNVLAENWETWASQEQKFLIDATITMHKFSPFIGPLKSSNLINSWDYLFRGFRNVPIWQDLNDDMAEGIRLFLGYNMGRKDSEVIVSAITETKYSFQKTTDKRKRMSDFLTGLRSILMFIREHHSETLEKFRINANFQDYVKLMSIVASMDVERDYKKLLLTKDEEELMTNLKQLAEEGIDQEVAPGVEQIHNIYPYATSEWVEIKNKIQAFITKHGVSKTQLAGSLFVFLHFAEKPLQNDAFLTLIVRKSVLYGFLNYRDIIPPADSLLAALCVYIIHVIAPDSIPPVDKANSSPEREQGINTYKALMKNPKNAEGVVEEYAMLVAKYHQSDKGKVFDAIFKHFKRGQFEPFAKEVINRLALRDDAEKFFLADRIWEFYYYLDGQIPEESFKNIVDKACDNGDLVSKLTTSVRFSSIRPLLYLDILNRAPTNEEYVKFLVENLKAVSLQSFIDDYGDGRKNPGSDKRMQRDYPLLLIRLVELGNEQFIDDGSFVDLIATWMKQSYDENGQLPPALQGKEETLLKAFTPEARKRFLDQMGPEWDKYK